MVMATEQVEIFGNTIIDNKTAGTAIVSYFITEEETKDTQYNPYTSSIYVHDNIYRREPQIPTLDHDIGLLLFTRFYKDVPDIIYDGMPDPKHLGAVGYIPNSRRLCIASNVDADYLNLEISKNFESWYSPFFAEFKTDINECECEQEPIPEVVLDID